MSSSFWPLAQSIPVRGLHGLELLPRSGVFISRIGLAVHTGSARPIVSMDDGLQKSLELQKTLELLANLRDAKADDDLD